jgi:DNA modification methylase
MQSVKSKFELHHGDCLEVMSGMDADSVDAIVTDPPYGLSFMGKNWDHGIPGNPFWEQALRVAKPGAHLLAFGGTRTFHRLVCAIEDAGWEIRDCVMWVYGSGFPKSLDVGKAIDKAAGAKREVVGKNHNGAGNKPNGNSFDDDNYEWNKVVDITAPATEAAKQWDGWGTSLKPAWEPIILARKPLSGTVAENVLRHGVGGLNVDASRIGTDAGWSYPNGRGGQGWHGNESLSKNLTDPISASKGRFPANLIHDGSDEVVALFPETTSGISRPAGAGNGSSMFAGANRTGFTIGDSGSAARFFYTAKADKRDRDEGLTGTERPCGMMEDDNYPIKTGSGNIRETKRRNHHPTVKPTSLMRYLCKLITPPNGIILDPFTGSGSTGKAAMLEKFKFIGIEQDAEYIAIANARIEHAAKRRAYQFGLLDHQPQEAAI